MGDKVRIRAVVWTVGILGGLLLNLLRLPRIVKVTGYRKDKFIPSGKGLVVIYRHPSFREPALVPFLFFPWFLFDTRLVPFSTPSKPDQYDRWWLKAVRPVCIPVERGSHRMVDRTLQRMKARLDQKGVLLMAPAGGREFKGTAFKWVKAGKVEVTRLPPGQNYRDLLKESEGRVMRRFQTGIGWLLDNTKATVLPVWVETGRIRMHIIIGEQTRLPDGFSRKATVEALEDLLLALKT